MLTLDVLPARYGDALMLTYGTVGWEHRILIDGGFASTGEQLAEQIRDLDRPLDLVVVSHIDKDHIAGVVKLLGQDGIEQRIKRIWFNGFKHLEQFSDLLGPVDGERLTTKLIELGIDWNPGWPWQPGTEEPTGVGGPVVIADGPVRRRLPVRAQAIVLSPTPQKLADLIPKWKPVVADAGLDPAADEVEHPEADDSTSDMLGEPIKDLADADTSDDGSEANGSSIGFVFQFRTGDRLRRILVAGDAHPDVLVDGIDKLRRGREKYRVDAFKLPHHGSRANVTANLVKLLDCPQWIVSTNGVSHDHPNPEALARIVEYGGDKPTIVCNYRDNEPLRDFMRQYPPRWHRYEVMLPAAGEEGIQLSY